jgi:hypothetical protein
MFNRIFQRKVKKGKKIILLVFLGFFLFSTSPALAFNPFIAIYNYFTGTKTVVPPSALTSPSLLSDLTNAYKNYVFTPKANPVFPLTIIGGQNPSTISLPVISSTGSTSSLQAISDATLTSALERLLNNPNILSKLRGPQGLTGPKGDSGLPAQAGSSYSGGGSLSPAYIGVIQPNPATNFNGATLFSATNLSSNQFSTNTANITTLAVSGDTTLTGGLNVTGTANIPNLSGTAGALNTLTTPLIIGGTTTTSPLTLRSTSGIGTTGADIIFQTGNNGATEAMRILNNGYVGIGTSTPTYLLTVSKAGTNQGNEVVVEGTGKQNLLLHTTDATVNQSETGIVWQTPAGYALNSLASVDGRVLTTAVAGELIFNNRIGPIVFSADSSYARKDLYIATSGNVGIGTTSPQKLFHLASSSTNGTVWRFENSDTGGKTFDIFSTGSANSAGVGKFNITNTTANLFTIDGTTGNVGIGTTTPTDLLTIKGTTTEASLGTEMIIATADQNFSSSTGKWTGTGWTIGSNVITHTAGANALTLDNTALSATPVALNNYQVTFTVVTTVAGVLTPSLGGTNGRTVGQSTGTITAQIQLFTALTAGALTFTPDATWTGTIDDVSVKLVNTTPSLFTLQSSSGAVGIEMRSGGATLFNTFIGNLAGQANTTGIRNTAFGWTSLKANTTGSYNTAYGMQSLLFNTTGLQNTAIGYVALRDNVTGSYNTAIGDYSLNSNTTGSYNVATGDSSLYNNTTGVQNVATGDFSLNSNTTGSSNTAIGDFSLFANITGGNNTAMGLLSLYNATNSFNTGIGYQAGRTITTGDSNTFLGYSAGYNALQLVSATNSTAIGSGAYTTASNQVVIGNTSVTQTLLNGSVGIGTTAPAGLLHIATSTTALGLTILEQASADTDAYDISLRKARGTIASPTTVVTGDDLGSIMFRGYATTNGYIANGGALIKAIATGTIGTTRIPSALTFSTSTDVATSVLTERMRIDNAGNVGIGTITPTKALDIYGNDYGFNGASIPTEINNKSQAGALYFDGMTTDARVYHTMNQDIGTSDFTMYLRLKIPTSAVAGTVKRIFFLSSNNNARAAFGTDLYFYGDGDTLGFGLFGATTADQRIYSVPSVMAKWGGKIIDYVAVRDATNSAVRIYINGVLQTTTDTTGGTPPAVNVSIVSTYALIGGYTTNGYSDRIYKASVFNRVLSQTDVAQLSERGTSSADEWGNLTPTVTYITPTLNGGFETAGTNGGTITNVPTATRAVASNVATITTSIPHGLTSTNVVTITTMTDATYNATNKVVTVINPTTFTYPLTHADEAQTADTAGRIATSVFGTWTSAPSGISTSTVSKETSIVHSGSNAVKMTVDASGGYIDISPGSFYTLGKWYRVSFWARNADGATGGLQLANITQWRNVSTGVVTAGGFTTGTLNATYTQYTAEIQPTLTYVAIGRNNAANGTLYIDDVVISEVGAVLDSDLENADPAKSLIVRDRSSNKFVGTVTATGVTQIKPVTQLNPSILTMDAGIGTAGASGVTSGWFNQVARIYTDNATAGSGTAASFAFNNFAIPTLAASNTLVTTTNAATVYIAGAPANGTNMTVTNPLALWVNAGRSRFDAGLSIGSSALNATLSAGSLGTGTTTMYIGTYTVNTTAPSDISVKENIVDTNYGLTDLMKLSVKDFTFKKEFIDEGDTQKVHTGMIAQDVEPIYPEAIIYRSDNLKAIDYTKLTPLVIKSIKDLNLNIEAIAGITLPLSGSPSESFVTAFFNNVYTKITTWMGEAGNGITKFFVGEVHVTDKLCADDICIDKDQLKDLLIKAGGISNLPQATSAAAGGDNTPSPVPAVGDIEPPVITLTGEATINLNVGDPYTEQGATATDDVDTSVDVIISGLVDTTTAGAYTITYNAKDIADNSAVEIIRTINVNEVAPVPEIPPVEPLSTEPAFTEPPL